MSLETPSTQHEDAVPHGLGVLKQESSGSKTKSTNPKP